MKVKYSAIGITNMSGKSGGSVASFNRHGAYIRRWAKPTNPQSNLQTAVRSSFGGWARAFGHLSESAREAWKIFGQNNPRKDRLGDSRAMSALNAFMSVNQNREIAGFTGQLSEPRVLDFALPSVNINTAGSDFTFDPAVQALADTILAISIKGLLTVADFAKLKAIVRFTKVNSGSAKSYGSVKNQYSFAEAYTVTGANTSLNLADQLSQVDFAIGDSLFVEVYLIAENGLASEKVTQEFTIKED